MEKCNTCFYQEKRHDGKLICQHIQSVAGMEAYEDYKLCEEIVVCSLYKKSKIRCLDCKGNCLMKQQSFECDKNVIGTKPHDINKQKHRRHRTFSREH